MHLFRNPLTTKPTGAVRLLRIKSILDPFHPDVVLPQFDADDVKAHRTLPPAFQLQIIQSGFDEPRFFEMINRFQRQAVTVRAARFDFHKTHRRAIADDEVHLSPPAAEIPLQDPATPAFQKILGEGFPRRANPLIIHGTF